MSFRDDRSWFNRTMDSGRKRRGVDLVQDPPPHPLGGDPHVRAAAGTGEVNDTSPHRLEESRLAAKAEAFSAALAVARRYESRNANAAAVRIALSFRADEAWERLEAHHHSPTLAETEDLTMASVSASGNGEPSEQPLSPRPELTAGAKPPLLLGEGSSPSPLERFALERLAFIADSLGRAAAELDTPDSRKVFGGAGRSLAEYLRTMQAFAGGTTRVLEPVPEPTSLRVGPPNLRVVS